MKTFKDAVRDSDFALCAELPLNPDSSRESLLSQAKSLSACTDALYIPDNRFGRIHMSSLAASAVLLQNGYDPIMELSCRNRNKVALLSDLLGARELGVSNLMLVRGKRTPAEIQAKQTFAVDANVVELLGLATNVYRDENKVRGDAFLIGTMATIHAPGDQVNPETLNGKIQAGAQVLQTQLCLNSDLLQRYMKYLRSEHVTRSAFVIVGTCPIPSYEAACELRDNQSHLRIPDKVLRRLKQAHDPELEGIKICAEFLQEAKEIPGVSGARIICPTNIDSIPKTIELAGLQKEQ
ncbi:MAG: methylenetetrahydrofolate reductase [Pseudomonadales bacterium]